MCEGPARGWTGAGGAMGVMGAGGTGASTGAGTEASRAGGSGRELDPPAAASLSRTTLECRAHLCRFAVLRDWNLHPQTRQDRSRGGSWAALAASRSRSCLAARLRFRARRCFSFWALLALRPPFWSSKKAR